MNAQDAYRIMEQANSVGLRFGWHNAPVRVSGAKLPFAKVTVKNGHPLAGFSAEYSWQAIERATVSGVLR